MDRVKTIRQLSNKDQWRFCPGALNPADLPVHGKYGKNLPTNKLWQEGSEFLKKSRDHWPENLSTSDVGQSVALEEQIKNLLSITYTLTSSTNPPLKACVLRIIDIDRFGKKSRLIRTVAWVFRFIRNLRAKTYPVIEKTNTEILNTSELRQAENLLIISVQDKTFTKELNYLMNPKKGESYIPLIHVRQFNLYVDEQRVLRSQTRVTNASPPETNKNPILLPTRYLFTKLVIKEYHERVYHNGVCDTLTAIRQNFWILRNRQAVKSVAKGCVTCKKLEGLPFKANITPPLPDIRVGDSPPFPSTGLDFAGPLFVSDVDRKALHLEFLRGLDVESILRSFRRFSALRVYLIP